MNTIQDVVSDSIIKNNPISILAEFIKSEKNYKQNREVDKMHFVGYVLDLNFDTVKIITSDQYKLIVGGIPRGSFLIMLPHSFKNTTPHFSLLRVKDVSTTPLGNQVQQTYFELHKKSMPELDIWTQNELQWGALECDLLGMFYANPEKSTLLEFSGDVNNIVSAHKYQVYSPTEELLNLIINETVSKKSQFNLGFLRTMECRIFNKKQGTKTPVLISMDDFKGRRTAMFGKTRLGKSNVVKLLAQGMIDTNSKKSSNGTVGQLIFDINGEYANDNPQDGNQSIRSNNEEQCEVYALTKRAGTNSKPLRINFYEYPLAGFDILSSLIKKDKKDANYIKSFINTSIVDIDEISDLDYNEKKRAVRKILYYWAILYKAGFSYNEKKLKTLISIGRKKIGFNPEFSKELRLKAYNLDDENKLPKITSLETLSKELKTLNKFRKENPDDDTLQSKSKKPIFDADDVSMLDFLFPIFGSGASILRAYIEYHDSNADDFRKNILKYLDDGKTIILDLGNASDAIRKYFSDILSLAVFNHQEMKFINNSLNNHYIQLYFEEAHNLFPSESTKHTDIYSRFAKEGAKFHIGMVYSTQSPSTISKELLAQTENFFVGHLSSQDETKALSRLQVAYSGLEKDILSAKTPGFMRMLTMSNRFVVPVQVRLYKETFQGEQ